MHFLIVVFAVIAYNLSNKLYKLKYTNTVIDQHHISLIKRNHANELTHNNPLQLLLTLFKPQLLTVTDKQLTLQILFIPFYQLHHKIHILSVKHLQLFLIEKIELSVELFLNQCEEGVEVLWDDELHLQAFVLIEG